MTAIVSHQTPKPQKRALKPKNGSLTEMKSEFLTRRYSVEVPAPMGPRFIRRAEFVGYEAVHHDREEG